MKKARTHHLRSRGHGRTPMHPGITLLTTGKSRDDILRLYPYLEPVDLDEAAAYAAWRSEEAELPLK